MLSVIVTCMDDDTLMTSPTLPCKKCGASVTIEPWMTVHRLRRDIEWHRRAGHDRYVNYHLEKLRTLPGVRCHGSHQAEVVHVADCEYCGAPFVARRSSARLCSPRCRVAKHRAAV